MKKRKEQTQGSKQTYSLDKYISSSKNNPQELSFKGSESLLNFVMTASHNLENNRTCRLISTDSGMILGRMVNSRHAAERFEYGFRDLCSIFFYNFSTGLTIFALSKLLRKTDVHPKAIEKVCEFLKDKNLSGDEILSTLNKYDEDVFNKIKFQDNGTIKLKNLIGELYREGATIGDGSAMAAASEEIKTGILIGGRNHVTKIEERIKNLENILRTQNLTEKDKSFAKELLIKMKKSLKGEY